MTPGTIDTGVGLIRCERLDRLALRRSERELRTLRFFCQSWCFAFIREGLQRYPIEHTRLSIPLPGDTWWHHPKAPHVLQPGSPLRSWLFGFGAGIRIEAPVELRDELRQRLKDALAVYQPV